MAKIAIAARANDNATVAAVRGVTGLPLADIKKRLASGAALFEDDYYIDPDEMPRQIRALVATLQRGGVEPEIYELGDDEELAKLSDMEKAARRITATSLENRLTRFEQAGVEQRRQMAEEAEDDR